MAIQTLESRFQESLTSPDPADFAHIEHIIQQAISHGSPMYDDGDIEGCAEIYHLTARRLLTQLHGAIPAIAGSRMSMVGKNFDDASAKQKMSRKTMGMGQSQSSEAKDWEVSALLNAADAGTHFMR